MFREREQGLDEDSSG